MNPLDVACCDHDIAYSRRKDLEGRREADRALAERARQRVFANDATFSEKATATGVWATMKAKTKLGMGMRRTKRKQRKSGRKHPQRRRRHRNLRVAKRGGFLQFLPFVLPALSAIGALAGGAAGITKGGQRFEGVSKTAGRDVASSSCDGRARDASDTVQARRGLEPEAAAPTTSADEEKKKNADRVGAWRRWRR